ncbi:ActS/PrrB/RegB family redox-sensitive histidine kinase [Roseicyclus sp. F158]|uniref:histidine kinase n=1 Tax=Tropicimonas omnivorans TaxID=3075590 RepID=A0ABU3DCM8_9RHOB|nr:ActS/PrrB/RegB family redox-sensitive histidine kinase [Roseicyclus sp. F158]MDT0681461.1 ActS/PrrB/RegB family redox-sensitive histidine kinase [Roseicyclus sp. F158]
MADTSADLPGSFGEETNRIRLRTLIVLRWIAILGQIAAIEVGRRAFGLELPVLLCYAAIGTAVLANLVAIFLYPETTRLTEGETVLTLMFDVVQLGFLLMLSGGLNNPFALLMLAPVTIAATALRLDSALMIGAAATALLTVLAFVYLPIRSEGGEVLHLPILFLFGFWAATVIGVGFVAGFVRQVSGEIQSMSDALLATQMALAREQKLTDLGGVVAAAAHELGTPLATIKLVSSELVDELGSTEHGEDARLIGEQADRCRDILRSMGRAGKDDLHVRQAPLDGVLREAAEPHEKRGKDIAIDCAPAPGADSRQPVILRRPEIIHGLRNLIQNAVDFAAARVWIEVRWTDSRVTLRITDDGPGFPPNLIGRIGDPFVARRRDGMTTGGARRPGYEGMGLGLFIAKTLLERTGAKLVFSNAGDTFDAGDEPVRHGASVQVTWPLSAIAAPRREDGGLGRNEPNAWP